MNNLSRKICDYIATEWVGNQTKTDFALNHNIDEKTARRICNDKTYNITLFTLEKICVARSLTLAQFFELIKR